MPFAPLPAQTKYWARPEDRQRAVNAIFERSARQYDRACDILSFGSGRRYRLQALERAGLAAGMTVLDVGVGTGQLAKEAARDVTAAGQVTGIDPSRAMMAAGRPHHTVRLVQGVGESLPFRDDQFDFVTMGYALRHVPDLDQTFAEYRRVLRPNGRVLLLELTPPRSAVGRAAARVYLGTIGPLLARLGTQSAASSDLMHFYWETIRDCVAPDLVLASLIRARFRADRRIISGLFSEYVAVRETRQRVVSGLAQLPAGRRLQERHATSARA